jgi:hypothetical protein
MTLRHRSAPRRPLPGALALASALFCTAALPAQIVRLGSEFQVNTTTAESQFAPAVAGEIGGPFLVAWQSSGQDGSGAGIYARLFAADGTALTGEIRIPQTTAGDQVTPAVAYHSTAGTFLVAWASNGQDGDGYGIYARRLQASNGQLLGDEFRVNASTSGNQVAPRIAAQSAPLHLGVPTFFVAWSGPGESGDTNEIFARGFAAGSGAATTGEVRLNSTVSGNQLQPAIAAAASGLVAAWASSGQDGSGFGIVARRFSFELSPASPEIAVPEISIFDQSAPAVAGFVGGDFAVAWQRSLQAESSTVGPQPVIALRRFSGSTASGPEVQVQNDVSRRHEAPVVAGFADAVTVAWQEIDLATGDKQALASRFDAANAPVVVDFPLNTTYAGDQISPALDGLTRLVATWASFGQDGSSYGIFAQRLGSPLPPCVADSTTLCLQDGRFQVRATWATAAGAHGAGQAVALTADSGYYWFFDDANVEIVIKLIDACGFAGFDNYWVFATGLTNVAVDLHVVDTWSGDEKLYANALDHSFEPILDSGHFRVCEVPEPTAGNDSGLGSPDGQELARGGWAEGSHGARSALPQREDPVGYGPDRTPSGSSTPTPQPAIASEGNCVANARTLCLFSGRFEVKIDFETAQGATGDGQAIPLTDESGYFWFFDDANVELVIKVIDACDFNDRYWVFAGGLTNVETHLTVRDTQHPGAVFTSINPLNQDFAPILDGNAFATCP